MEDIQDIMDNISGEQESISEWLKEIITKIKKRNKLIKTADSYGGGWAVVKEYEKKQIGSDSDDCEKIWQPETKALKKSKSFTFKSSSTHGTHDLGISFGMRTSSTLTFPQFIQRKFSQYKFILYP